MYNNLHIVPARLEDAIQMNADLRSADRAELEAACGPGSALHSLIYGVSFGKAWAMRETFYPDDIDLPFVLFGVMPFSKTVGIPWMVATDDLIKHKRFVIRNAPACIDAMHALYPDGLLNFIDARNTVHIAFIKHFGFVIDGLSNSYGVSKLPFLRFSKNLKGQP